jgi:hypothetical protein
MVRPTVPAISIWIGPDRVRKLKQLREQERALAIHPLDRHRLSAAGLSTQELMAFCRQQPAASPVRLVVVDDAHQLAAACVEALCRHAATITKTARVILLVDEEPSPRHPLARACRVDAPRAGGQAPVGKDRQPETPFALERFPATSEPAARPFALTDALGSGDVAQALAALAEQRGCGREPLELLGVIAWQLQRWVTIRRLKDLGCTPSRMAAMTGLRPWQLERAVRETAFHSLARLQELLARCWRLDVDAKSGRILADLAIDQLVVKICLRRG